VFHLSCPNHVIVRYFTDFKTRIFGNVTGSNKQFKTIIVTWLTCIILSYNMDYYTINIRSHFWLATNTQLSRMSFVVTSHLQIISTDNSIVCRYDVISSIVHLSGECEMNRFELIVLSFWIIEFSYHQNKKNNTKNSRFLHHFSLVKTIVW
jgi:membrane-bound metal-dependent hydrolase YbcI (DUF457 family)